MLQLKFPSYIIRFMAVMNVLLCINLTCAGQLEGDSTWTAGGTISTNTTYSDTDPNVINGVAVPVDFIKLIISHQGNTAPGQIFLANNEGPPYLLAFNNDGTPAYYERLEYSARDFKVHPNGNISYSLKDDDNFTKGFVLKDSNFATIDTIPAAKGYKTDVHDLTIAPNGNYLLIAVSYLSVDMSQVIEGGDPDAELKGCHVHELNKDKELVFEWVCWDHYEVSDAIGVDLRQRSLDYVHMNSVAVDYDGHLVVSSRNLSECTKINRQTGEIIWRLGGKNDQFEWINDNDKISNQHDIRPVKGKPNQYTIFDNGNSHNPQYSRVIEIIVDTSDMTVEKVWEYRHSPDIFSYSMGNAQRLENGNTMINYSDVPHPKVCEVTNNGEIVFEADLDIATHCYRTFRFDWNGTIQKPYLLTEKYPDKTHLIFNKFGDLTVDHYRIYSGTDPHTIVLSDSTENTWITYTNLADSSWHYFQVSAIHTDGSESSRSGIDSIFNFHSIPGENLVYNGDFSLQNKQWLFDAGTITSVSDTVENEEYIINIGQNQNNITAIRLSQKSIPLIKGKEYHLEFDISSENRVLLGVDLTNPVIVPPSDYSKIGLFYAQGQKQHFQYQFVMNNTTDLNTRLEFLLGRATGTIHIDNVNLMEIPEPIVANLSNVSQISCYKSMDGLIHVSASGGVGNLKYTLSPGSVENETGVFIIEQAGNYSVEVSDESAQVPFSINDIQIDEPQALVIESIEKTDHLQDYTQAGSLLVHASGGNGNYIFTLFPDSITNTSGYFTQLDTGSYQVMLKDSLECDSVLSAEIIIEFIVASIEDIATDSWLRIYPNPASDKINMAFDHRPTGELQVSIFSQSGTMVKNFHIPEIDNLGNVYPLDTGDLPGGLYLIRIITHDPGSSANNVHLAKFILR